MASYHAKLSPSGAHRWIACPGSVAAEDGLPNTSSEFAEEGTRAHEWAALLLESGQATSAMALADDDMAGHVRRYVDTIRQYAEGNQLFVETRVPIGHITGEEGATGTADAIVITADGSELQLHDLKYGRGVEVSAEDNEQLMLYALGALEEYEMALADKPTFRLVIHQVRLAGPSEWVVSYDDLMVFRDKAMAAAEAACSPGAIRVPGVDQCRFCKAKATCPALAQFVSDELDADFDELAEGSAPAVPAIGVEEPAKWLGQKMDAIGLIEGWCKAVRAETEKRLLQGDEVPGYKLVQGRRGARAWSSEDEAEKLFKSFRLKTDEMYDLKLISPTTAEKRLKDQPKRWAKVVAVITHPQGKPSVAPVSDKRPAITPGASDADFSE